MSSLVKVRSKDFPALAKMSAGQTVTLVLKGRVGSTTLDGENQMVELAVSSIETSKNGRMSPTQAALARIEAQTSRTAAAVEQVNTPRP
jgi:hypothetical protein